MVWSSYDVFLSFLSFMCVAINILEFNSIFILIYQAWELKLCNALTFQKNFNFNYVERF